MVQGKTMCNFDCKISDLKLYLQKWEWSEYYLRNYTTQLITVKWVDKAIVEEQKN